MSNINIDTGYNDNAKAEGHEARYKGLPIEANPYDANKSSVEHLSWNAGWNRENEILLGVTSELGEPPPEE